MFVFKPNENPVAAVVAGFPNVSVAAGFAAPNVSVDDVGLPKENPND